MAIDKSRTPLWMKVVLVGVALSFVLGFCSLAANPFTLFKAAPTATQTADPSSIVATQHQGNVGYLTQQLQSDPESYTVLVQLGNEYFDWAAGLQSLAATNSALVGSDLPVWNSAKDAYSRALKVRSDEPPVRIDYSITLFYTGDTNQAVKVATAVSKETPQFAPAWFNLGIFEKSLGETATAIANLEHYLKLDPNGQQANAAYARQTLQELQGTTTK